MMHGSSTATSLGGEEGVAHTTNSLGGEEGVAQNSLRGEYAAMLRRRKWVALPSLVIVPVTAVVLALYGQQARYQATAQVLIKTDSAATRLIAGQGGTEDPARLAQTQASLARA